MPCRFPMQCLMILLFSLGALSSWQARGEEVAGQQRAPEAQKPGGTQTPAVILEPFYFFRERDSGVWVERVLVHLEADGQQAALEGDTSPPRALLQEILESQADEGQLADRALAALRQALGPQAVRGLKISRSTMILP